MGVFILSGINCTEAFIGPHRLGVGDHRGPHIVSITMESVLGTTDPSPTSYLKSRQKGASKFPRT